MSFTCHKITISEWKPRRATLQIQGLRQLNEHLPLLLMEKELDESIFFNNRYRAGILFRLKSCVSMAGSLSWNPKVLSAAL